MPFPQKSKKTSIIEVDENGNVIPKEIKKNKYNAVKVTLDGRVFDSTSEGERYLELKRQQEEGLISNLKMQFPIKFALGGKHIFTYLADFTYELDGKTIVEDVKSTYTQTLPVYRLKKKLIEAHLGIIIKEVTKEKEKKK